MNHTIRYLTPNALKRRRIQVKSKNNIFKKFNPRKEIFMKNIYFPSYNTLDDKMKNITNY